MTNAELLYKIMQLESFIESGYGYTGKPIPQKRMKKLREKVEELKNKLQK